MRAAQLNPPVSKLAIVFYALGVVACVPALLASTLVGAMGGSILFMFIGFAPLLLFAAFGLLIQRFNNVHWYSVKNSKTSNAKWSKLAVVAYAFAALGFAVFAFFILQGGFIFSPYMMLENGKILAVPVAFLTVGHMAQKLAEILHTLDVREEKPNA